MYQKACYTGLPNISVAPCISIRTQSRSEPSTDLSSAHSPTFPSLHLRHNSFSIPSVALTTSQLFSNHSVALPMSQFILQPFFRFFYVTSSSLDSPGEPPMSLGHIIRQHWFHKSTIPESGCMNSGSYAIVTFLLHRETLISQSLK